MKGQDLKQIMQTAWRFFRITGYSFGECLKKAWANFKLVRRMQKGIVRFYFQKIDGTIREAWGTLRSDIIAEAAGSDRKRNDTVQTYWDTEKQEYRCFKKLNLIYNN